MARQSGNMGEDVATEATEASCDVTQPWDMPQETVEVTAPVDMQAATGLQGAVSASPSVSQISQFLDTLSVPAEGRDKIHTLLHIIYYCLLLFTHYKFQYQQI